ncbi:MAG: hypothetical protein AAFV07_12600, partial [Bacteroidota bacterium]
KTPTWYADGEASGDMCSCCDVELGYEDGNLGAVFFYRNEWIEKVLASSSKGTKRQLQQQLLNISAKWLPENERNRIH